MITLESQSDGGDKFIEELKARLKANS
jgi:hypothetical protein